MLKSEIHFACLFNRRQAQHGLSSSLGYNANDELKYFKFINGRKK
jgi:hypothetical protein